MQFGFAIDHRRCIGCHACTVACKAENEVPLGSFRTWVKYVEKGAFPQVRRHFTVLRCNHCDRAPCVEICPVNALHKRPDAIVDLDRDICIGCRACMQGCPYDALYFNTDRGVAEKCHYCAHRTEIGLEPACVVVCPVEAIVSGDTSDRNSKIATLIREQPADRRKLEKGTMPRVWYVDALPEALVPGQTSEPASFLWSERPAPPLPVLPGLEATPDLMTTLDIGHPPAWGWHVWAYLMTKNAAAGAALAAPFLAWLGVAPSFGARFGPEIAALLFWIVTNILLVHDLGRPGRFWRLLLRPNRRSWLVKGAWVLMAFGGVTAAALATRALGFEALADTLRWANLPFAVLASGYSAWLFAQCRGRDLWLERGLFGRLVLRCALLGSALPLFLLQERAGGIQPAHVFAALAFANALSLHRELRSRPGTRDGRKAHVLLARALRRSQPRWLFLGAGILALGVPAAGDLRNVDFVLRTAMVLQVVVALVAYERAWIRSGQEVPLS